MIKISNTVFKIVQVGTGATGSWLISMITQLLANNALQENSLLIIDSDKIEDKNLKNQKFLKKDVGKFKSEVLCERYQGVYPDLQISYLSEYIKNKDRLLQLLQVEQYANIIPILIGTVDNNSTRQIFHSVFHDDNILNLIYIDSGNGTDNMIGQTVVGYKSDGKVILKPIGDIAPDILIDNDAIDKVLSCSYHSEEAPQNIGTNITAATMLFNVLNNIISFNCINTHIVYFNAKRSDAVCKEAINKNVKTADKTA